MCPQESDQNRSLILMWVINLQLNYTLIVDLNKTSSPRIQGNIFTINLH